jgi:hypothetical protein
MRAKNKTETMVIGSARLVSTSRWRFVESDVDAVFRSFRSVEATFARNSVSRGKACWLSFGFGLRLGERGSGAEDGEKRIAESKSERNVRRRAADGSRHVCGGP